MGVIPWRWHGEGSIEGEIDVEQLLAATGSDFAGGYVYEETEPSETNTFSARGLTWAQVDALRDFAKQRLYLWTIVTDEGAWTGYRRNFSWKKIEGTERWEVTLVLLAAPTEPEDE